MANEIIYGCVKADRTIIFTQTGIVGWGDCVYSACIHRTGIHADQVAVTVETGNCEIDIYYGCVDWSNDGKFEISVPDNCCSCVCSEECSYVNTCTTCYPANETPEKICVVFEGVRLCSDNSLAPMNGEHVLIITATSCRWESADGHALYCTGPLCAIDSLIIYKEGADFYFNWSDIAECGIEGLASNSLSCGGVFKGYGGTAKLCNPCTGEWR